MNLRRYQSQLVAAAMAMMCTAAEGAGGAASSGGAANSIEAKDFMLPGYCAPPPWLAKAVQVRPARNPTG